MVSFGARAVRLHMGEPKLPDVRANCRQEEDALPTLLEHFLGSWLLSDTEKVFRPHNKPLMVKEWPQNYVIVYSLWHYKIMKVSPR